MDLNTKLRFFWTRQPRTGELVALARANLQAEREAEAAAAARRAQDAANLEAARAEIAAIAAAQAQKDVVQDSLDVDTSSPIAPIKGKWRLF